MYKFKEGARVCFFGDSITFNGLWIRRIFDYYLNTEKIKCEMYNFGVGGNTSQRGYKRINKIYRYDPTDVVIMFGMNDVCGANFSTRPLSEHDITERRQKIDEQFGYYKKICEELSAKGINLIFCTPTSYDEISDVEETALIGVSGALKEYADRVKGLANAYGGHVVDFNDCTFAAQKQAYKVGGSYINDDRIHPNPVGNELMARFFLRAQGFDVDCPYDYFKLEELSKQPYNKWEDERFKLEGLAKSTDYVRYDYFADVKEEDLIQTVKDAIKNHVAASWAKGETLKYVEDSFQSFLDNVDKVEGYIDDYINFTKTALNK